AGVVDQDVDPAERVVGRLDQRVDLVPPPDVTAVRQGPAAERLDFGGHLPARVHLAAGDDHVGPGAGERQGHLAPQAPAAAGDQRDLAGEIENVVHSPCSFNTEA